MKPKKARELEEILLSYATADYTGIGAKTFPQVIKELFQWHKKELKRERLRAYKNAIKLFKKIKGKIGDEPMTARVVILELKGLIYREQNEN